MKRRYQRPLRRLDSRKLRSLFWVRFVRAVRPRNRCAIARSAPCERSGDCLWIGDSHAPTSGNARKHAADLNPGTIAYAQSKFRPTENIEWHKADAPALPFPDVIEAVARGISKFCGDTDITLQAFVWHAVRA